jgi:hypothetical protein
MKTIARTAFMIGLVVMATLKGSPYISAQECPTCLRHTVWHETRYISHRTLAMRSVFHLVPESPYRSVTRSPASTV